MGREYITFGFNICHDGNIDIIFIKYFVDENKYIMEGVAMFSLFKLTYSKQKHSQIKGLVVKYLKSGFGANLGQLCVRLFDDMLLIIHHMRFSLRSV